MKRTMREQAATLLPATALLLSLACSDSNDLQNSPVTAGTDGGGEEDAAMPQDMDPLKAMGPTEGEFGQGTTSFVDLEGPGYSEKEYFFEGVASAYAVEGSMTMDGKWILTPGATAPFKTRLYVRRPIDASRFNGTVVIEWLNVSGGLDADPGYMYNNPLVFREGWVWIGVSAQQVGVEGGFSISQLLGGGSGEPQGPGSRNLPLKMFDPERYGSLSHPGDDFSFDIFTQAARVVRGEGGVDVLEGLEPQRIIAYGESQSAGRMVSYVNGAAPIAKVFDGYFIHSRGAGGSGFSSMGGNILAAFGGGGTPILIRDDLDVPVLQFQTETDVHGMLDFLPARQPDSDLIRTWEVAGTAHADKYLTDQGSGVAGSFTCEGANDGPQQFVIRAALLALDRWIAGTLPPATEPLEIEDGKPVLDEHGNTLGGVRSPDVDAPIAIQSGSPPADGGGTSAGGLSFFCGIFGSTVPFSAEQLLELYPTHEDYVTKVKDSARSAVEQGFLLAPEEESMVAEAEAAPIPE